MTTRYEARERLLVELLRPIAAASSGASLGKPTINYFTVRQEDLRALLSPEGDGSEGRGDALSLRESQRRAWFQTRYRIVTDRYNGFETQKKLWWLPVWFMVGGCNTSSSIEKARALAFADMRPVVEYVTAPPGNRKEGSSHKTTDKGGE